MANNRDTHDSYGLLSLSRWSSSHRQPFFGSDIAHDRGITLTVSSAVRERSHNRDRYYEEETILQLEMTESQFAEMITTLNIGNGVPVTLKAFTDGDMVRPTPPPVEPKGDLVIEEAKQAADDATDEIRDVCKELQDLITKGKPNKGELNKLLDKLKAAAANIDDHLPFMVSQFAHTVEKMVIDAKATMSAAAPSTILEDMRLPQLEDKGKKKKKKKDKKK